MATIVIDGLTAEETELILRERAELARARTWFSFTAILNLVLFYCLAFSIVGFDIGVNLIWPALSCVAVGLLIAFTICSWAIFAKIENLQQLKDRQLFIGMWVKIAIAVCAGSRVFGRQGFVSSLVSLTRGGTSKPRLERVVVTGE